MTTTSAADVLAERYGRQAPWRRRSLLGLVALVVLAFAAWLVWTVWVQSRPEVTSQQIGFSVVDDNTARATVQVVFRNDTVQATCTVQAYAADHTVVGQVEFSPDAHASGRVFTQDVQTERRATSVEAMGCTAPGQNRPR